jgi:hypothetical protein
LVSLAEYSGSQLLIDVVNLHTTTSSGTNLPHTPTASGDEEFVLEEQAPTHQKKAVTCNSHRNGGGGVITHDGGALTTSKLKI